MTKAVAENEQTITVPIFDFVLRKRLPVIINSR